MNNTLLLKFFTCLFFFAIPLTFYAQVDLELRITADKPTLGIGETTRMTLTMENKGTEEAVAIAIVNTIQEATIAEDNQMISSGDFNGFAWSQVVVLAGDSATLSFDITSQVPFLQLYTEVVAITNGLSDVDSEVFNIEDRCRGNQSCDNGEATCIFEAFCELEDDEARYPNGEVQLDLISVSCPPQFPTPNGELTYDLVIKNNGNIPSGIETLGFFRTVREDTSSDLDAGRTTSFGNVEIPEIGPGDSVTVTHTFNYSLFTVFRPGFYHSFPSFINDYRFSFDADGRNSAATVDLFCQKNNSDIELQLMTEQATISTDNRLSYQALVINNGDEMAHNLELLYAQEDSQIPVLGFVSEEMTDLSGTYFSTARVPGQPINKYWHIPTLGVGDTAVLFVDYIFNAQGDLNISTASIAAFVRSGHLEDPVSENNQAILTVPFEATSLVDVELSIASSRPDIAQYESGTFTFTLTNTGVMEATDVAVELDLQDKVIQVGGSEAIVSAGDYTDGSWENITIPAQGSVTLTLELFSFVPLLEIYAEVTEMGQDDDDSMPGNGVCCTPVEDDEAVFNATIPNIDLELSITANNNPLLTNDTNTVVILLNNNSPSFASSIQVELPLGDQVMLDMNSIIIASNNSGFDPSTGVWTIDTLPGYNIARLELTIVPSTADYVLYGQVIMVDQLDDDSTPDNGTCCTPVEDDEATLVGLRNAFVGVNSSPKKILQVYPNPAKDELNLPTIPSAETPYIIFNSVGQQMQTGQINNGMVSLNNLPAGVYYLKIDDKELAPIRFVKL